MAMGHISGMNGRIVKRRQEHEPEYRFFFYDASSQKADYLAVWVRMEKYPTVIRHTGRERHPRRGQNDRCTHRATCEEPAQFGWAVAELEIEKQSKVDTAE